MGSAKGALVEARNDPMGYTEGELLPLCRDALAEAERERDEARTQLAEAWKAAGGCWGNGDLKSLEDDLADVVANMKARADRLARERDLAQQGEAEAHDAGVGWRRERRLMRAEAAELRAALVALVAALPRCTGEWVSGSGGHRRHKPCGAPAVWLSEPYRYCAEHVPTGDVERGEAIETVDQPEALDEALRLLDTKVKPG